MNKSKEKKYSFDFSQTIKDYSGFAVLLTAIELGIFEALKDEFLSINELKQKCKIKLKNRNLSDFLDILYINNHLLREGKLETAKYKCSHDLFQKMNPNSMLSLISLTSNIITRYNYLAEIMLTGKVPENKGFNQNIYSDKQTTKAFLRAMSNSHSELIKFLSKTIDCKNFKNCLDLGGALGAFSIEMKKANPHINVHTFDLNVIEDFVIEYLVENQMIDNVNVISGDFFTDQFPKSDIIMMGNVLHNWNLEKKQLLIKKAYNSLNDNGVLIVVEKLIDDNEQDANGIYTSFNMFIECQDGYNLTKKELEDLAQKAGFITCKIYLFNNDNEVALLKKSKILNLDYTNT